MYPRNNATPERIAVGQVILISDGTIQTASVVITVRGQGGAEASGGGTTAYGADGTVYYTPTQAETNYTSFVVIASKASCFSASQTVITTASSTPGQVDVKSVAGTAQTANDNGADINAILVDTSTTLDDHLTDIKGTGFVKDAESLVQIESQTDDLESRLSAARAGYLDELAPANIPADLDNVLADTNELQTDWTNGGRLDLLVDAIKAVTDTLVNLTAAQVATEISDALNVDAQAELASVPAANASLSTKLTWMFMLARNKGMQTSTTKTLFADDGSTTVSTSTVSDDGLEFTRNEYI